MAQQKERLDILLVNAGLFASRERARGAIMAGLVLVNGQRVDKAGTKLPVDVALQVLGDDLPYVSRGGLKLAKAIETFGFDPGGKVMLDVGASTGGFTDCALQNGASKVYAIDVGYAQLAWSLRQNPQVVVMERTNIRYVTPDQLPELADAATIDVSFISLGLVLPPVRNLLKDQAEIIALIKPQFEAGREQVGKRGVVRDQEVHREVIERVMEAAKQCGLRMQALTWSPITGPEGNIEFLGYWTKHGEEVVQVYHIEQVVAAAHTELRAKQD